MMKLEAAINWFTFHIGKPGAEYEKFISGNKIDKLTEQVIPERCYGR